MERVIDNVQVLPGGAYQSLNDVDCGILQLMGRTPDTGKRRVTLNVTVTDHFVGVNGSNYVQVLGNDVRAWVAGALESVRRGGPPLSLLLDSKPFREQIVTMVRQALNDRTQRCWRQAVGLDKPVKYHEPDPVKLQRFLDRQRQRLVDKQK